MTSDGLEIRTNLIGREIFSRLRAQHASPFAARWWDERLMAFTMRDEAVKVQLFRLVDALPALRTKPAVARHLREYFQTVNDRLPAPLRRAVGWLPDDGLVGGLVAGAARFNATRLARRFIAGTTVDETLEAILDVRKQGLGFTIDLLGEAVLSEREAGQYQQQYLQFIDGLTTRARDWATSEVIDRGPTGIVPPVNVSVKLSSLYSQFDPIDPVATSRAVRERLRPILQLAKSRGAFVNVDMEQHAYKDLTIRIFQEVLEEPEFRDWPDVGIAIQAYLKSCGDDLKGLADWAKRRGTPVWVRLVKGAYWDFETVVAAQQNWPTPVWTQKPETDANFERQTAFLVEHRDLLRPAIGSHNVRSIAHALALEEQHGLPPGTVEFQMLYGMADEIKAALVQMGRRVRVYTPFGQLLPGMAYLVRRLLENTSNQSFLRAGFLDRLPVEDLLMNPQTKIRSRQIAVDATPHDNGRAIGPFRNEPLTDFSIAANRDAMSAALKDLHERISRGTRDAFPLIINGERISNDRTIDSANPSHSNQVIGQCTAATVTDVERAIQAAKAAFPAWRDTAVGHRAALLFRSAEILRRRRFELAAWEVHECGKQWREADADVAEAIDYCEFYGREMLRLAKPQRRDVPGEENETFYEPRGVAVTIAPWNFPLAILCGMTAAALVAGNPTIMKPAEQSSIIAAKLMEVFEEAGFPPGVVQFLPGIGEEIGPALVGHPDVSIIAFTGSRGVGLSINQLGGQTPPGQDHVKRVITEMGGKNATIIDDDADLDEAVHAVAMAAFGYAGQKCSACSRAIVLESIYDTFLDRLIEVTKSLRIGPAEDPGAFIGPVIDGEARDRILKMIETGKGEARLAYAGELGELAAEGFYVAPHIFAEVPSTATIAQEEIFGPMLSVIRARDLSEAISIANGTRYALTGGLHSRSPANIERVRREFRVGNLYINRKVTGALVDRQPFGGFKLSGTGPKAGGHDYLPQFLNARTITENTLRHGFAPVDSTIAEEASALGE
ncbi:MAG TPA: L-glutamate gamma-semialdehyde dehydrogenase [Tepidisphaeraceae bacterium]|jgi:RHH-type proline utilization regulon transcriptional repressor/proline dehydrogenase/delta 1-pyrroline-5-carboxylate dehydrogenase